MIMDKYYINNNSLHHTYNYGIHDNQHGQIQVCTSYNLL